MIELLQKQVEELKQQVAELQGENTELKEEVENLNSQIDNLNKQINDLKAEVAEKDIEIADLKEEIVLKQETINNLQEQLDSINSQLSQTNATAAQILKDYKAYSGGKLLVGTMENRGAVSASLNAGQSYTIPAGYHNGSGKVTANSLESQTQATATADNITKGKNAWINGKLVTGTGKDNNTFYEQGKNETSSNEVVTTINCTVSDGPNYWSTVVWVDVSNFNTLELGTLTGGDAHNSSGVITVQADGRTILSETANGNKTLDVSKYEEVTIAIQGRYAKTMKLPIVLY